MCPFVIETFGLTRRFGSLLAVEAVDLSVPRGCVYGFLGPNGAGKTTTIRLLLGLLRPHAGNVLLFGGPLGEQRLAILRRVGSLVESASLYPHLTGWENLEVHRRMAGLERADIQRALSIVRLEADARRTVQGYSLGMRQRLGLAIAFLGRPQLLVLDEPANGLDPAGMHEMRDLIRSLPEQEGITVFLSSHLLSEVEQVATRLGIIRQGRLVFQGTLDDLRARCQDEAALVTDRLDESQRLLLKSGWQAARRVNQHLSVPVNGLSDVALLNRQLVQAGHQVYQLSLTRPSLEDIFLKMTEAGTQETH